MFQETKYSSWGVARTGSKVFARIACLAGIVLLVAGCATPQRGVSQESGVVGDSISVVLDDQDRELRQAQQKTRIARLAELRGSNGQFLSQQDCAAWTIDPIINSIGAAPTLTFQREARVFGDRRLAARIEIPIEGRDLYLPGCVDVRVSVQGAVDAAYKGDFEVSPSFNGDTFNVILNEQYLSRLKSGDRIEIMMTVGTGYEREKSAQCQRAVERRLPQHVVQRNCKRVVHYASRVFNVYEVEDFRQKIVPNRVEFQNLHAFPLPDAEAQALFGPTISKNFYVVKLSVRNDTDKERLITSGMIRASGRVMVEPEGQGVRYTLPVQLAPHSLAQVYEILDKQEPRQFRSWVFRSLEFLGSLATAANLAFVNSSTVTESVGILTGIAIPEGKKLFPSQWDAYKSNVVQFAMQDLAKIPRSSVMNQKLIFFPKNSISGLVSDPNLYGQFHKGPRLGGEITYQPEPPKAAVISVAFDSLDVPFENVFAVQSQTVEERLSQVLFASREVSSQLSLIRASWVDAQTRSLFGHLDYTSAGSNLDAPADSARIGVPMKAIESALTELADNETFADDGVSKTTLQALGHELALTQAALAALAPDAVGQNLIDGANAQAGLGVLETVDDQVDLIRRDFIRGVEVAGDDGRLKSLETTIRLAKARLVFYEVAAANIATLLAVDDASVPASLFLKLATVDKIKAMKEADATKLLAQIKGNLTDKIRGAHTGVDLLAASVIR